MSTFSLNFPVIGSSNPGEPKGKVAPYCKSYAWVPVLWSFNNSGRKGSSPTLFSPYLRTLLMIGVFGVETAVSFWSFGVGLKAEIFG